jgi:hypothetical protein
VMMQPNNAAAATAKVPVNLVIPRVFSQFRVEAAGSADQSVKTLRLPDRNERLGGRLSDTASWSDGSSRGGERSCIRCLIE